MSNAQSVLDQYWDGNLPVRPEVIAGRAGIELRPVVKSNQSGYYYYNNGQPYIEYNPEDGLERRRFTVAHELGHHFNGDWEAPRLDTVHNFSFNEWNPVEVNANRFAADLLMPESLVRFAVLQQGITDLENLADLFRVSGTAMYYRLLNLGLL